MFVELLLPDQLAAGGVDGKYVGLQVAEVHGSAPADQPDAWRRPHAALRLKRPLGAAALRVESIDEAAIAAGEDAAADDRGIPVRLRAAGKSERPFEFQLRDVRGGQARLGLKPRIAGVHAPAIPRRMRRQVAERGRPGRAQTRVGCGAGAERFTGEEFREPALVGRRDVDRLHRHAAARHRGEDRVGGALLQRVFRRRAPGRLIVAARAVVPVEGGGIWSLRMNGDGTAKAVPYEQQQRADRKIDERRTWRGERRTPNVEPRTPNAEPRTPNAEPRTNPEP